MPRLCKAAMIVFGLLWMAAVALLLVGTLGWFGAEKDPLSAVYLLPLGLPWNLFLDALPDWAMLWGGVLAPGINLLLLRLLCGVFNRTARAQDPPP